MKSFCDKYEDRWVMSNIFFPRKLKREFWRVARIIWIGHFEDHDGPFTKLPIEVIYCILKEIFQDMGISHNNLIE